MYSNKHKESTWASIARCDKCSQVILFSLSSLCNSQLLDSSKAILCLRIYEYGLSMTHCDMITELILNFDLLWFYLQLFQWWSITTEVNKLCLQLLNLAPHSLHLSCHRVTIDLRRWERAIVLLLRWWNRNIRKVNHIKLTTALFWMLRARLAYFNVLRVSSAFVSAGLTQALFIYTKVSVMILKENLKSWKLTNHNERTD